MRGGKKRSLNERLTKWCDDWRIALVGLKLAAQTWQFWLVAIAVFVVFGTLMNLLASGFTALNLLLAAGWGMRGQIVWDAFLGLFGVGRTVVDWLLVFGISLLQGVLIALLVLVWRKNRRLMRLFNERLSKTNTTEAATESTGAQSTGLVAGLAILGAGCPTCGTTLLTPLIGVVFSGGSYAVAGAVSGALVVLAAVIGLITVQKLGLQLYAIMVTEKRLARRGSSGVGESVNGASQPTKQKSQATKRLNVHDGGKNEKSH